MTWLSSIFCQDFEFVFAGQISLKMADEIPPDLATLRVSTMIAAASLVESENRYTCNLYGSPVTVREKGWILPKELLLNSLTTGRCGCALEWVIFKLTSIIYKYNIYIYIYIYNIVFSVKLPREVKSTKLVNSQHWFRWWLGVVR